MNGHFERFGEGFWMQEWDNHSLQSPKRYPGLSLLTTVRERDVPEGGSERKQAIGQSGRRPRGMRNESEKFNSLELSDMKQALQYYKSRDRHERLEQIRRQNAQVGRARNADSRENIRNIEALLEPQQPQRTLEDAERKRPSEDNHSRKSSFVRYQDLQCSRDEPQARSKRNLQRWERNGYFIDNLNLSVSLDDENRTQQLFSMSQLLSRKREQLSNFQLSLRRRYISRHIQKRCGQALQIHSFRTIAQETVSNDNSFHRLAAANQTPAANARYQHAPRGAEIEYPKQQGNSYAKYLNRRHLNQISLSSNNSFNFILPSSNKSTRHPSVIKEQLGKLAQLQNLKQIKEQQPNVLSVKDKFLLSIKKQAKNPPRAN